MSSVLRIIDANANRAREALRVMEEAARFHLEDRPLSEALKHLRHDLVQTIAQLDSIDAHRNVEGDVGTTIQSDTEHERASLNDVVHAASNRLSEALRAIEEYGKVVDAKFAQAVEALRYRAYALAQQLGRRLAATQPNMQWQLCLLLTQSMCRLDWQEVLEQSLDAGVDCVQVREKALDDRTLVDHARVVVKRCRAHGAAAIINDRPDIALAAGADGVHLGQNDLPCAQARAIVGRLMIIGISTSCLDEAVRALADGANYCGIGPMFASTTKHKDTIVGPAYLKTYLAWNRLPHLAIGGITAENVGELAAAGCRGIAVSSAVFASDRPGEVAQQLIEALSAPVAAQST